MTAARMLGAWSGAGVVVANMIGAGVFLSVGFMAQDMGPGAIMLAWLTGAIFALAGARAYAELAVILPRSGGEYRYLSDLFHPALGYLAGWASLLIGFSAPIAIDALAAGAFVKMIAPATDARLTAVIFLAALTVGHALGLRSSIWTQNVLIGIKLLLVVGFVVVGLSVGSSAWPNWTPPREIEGFPFKAFALSLFYIAFAFSGWNAAVYVTEEFRQPTRDVPRALLIGCGTVAVLYLFVNYVLIANLTPTQAQTVFVYEQTHVTLGHVVARNLLGDVGGIAMSVIATLVFVSAMSAMMLAGPRVYAAMANDGFLPRFFATRTGTPPRGSIVLQGTVALGIVFTHSLQTALQNAGAVLALFSALTVLTLFIVRYGRPTLQRPRRTALVAAGVHGTTALAMFAFGIASSALLIIWIAITATIGLVAYAVSRRYMSTAVH